MPHGIPGTSTYVPNLVESIDPLLALIVGGAASLLACVVILVRAIREG